jgi:hypothetical protein
MNKFLQIILIPFFSLIVLSCAKMEESSSSGSSSSSVTNERSSGANESSSCPGCKVLYIDKKSLSKYKTDNYLLFDPFQGHRQESQGVTDFGFDYNGSVTPDLIDLKENSHIMGPTFTIEMWIWSDQHGEQYQRIMGPNPRIVLEGKIANGNATINYGLHTRGTGTNYKPKDKREGGIRIRKVGWYHLAMTFDTNDDFIFYLDGEEVSRDDQLRGRVPWDNATGQRDKEFRLRYLGGKCGEGKGKICGGRFIGKIDDVRIWNVVRTQEQIQETIKSRNKPKTANEPGYENLVAYYPMDVNDDWELIDLSPNGKNFKMGHLTLQRLGKAPFHPDNVSKNPSPMIARDGVVVSNSFIIDEDSLPRFFSDDCPDGPDGSLKCPYPTIRSAMDDLHKRVKNASYNDEYFGYHLYVREGRYSEVLKKWHFNRDNQLKNTKETDTGEQVYRQKVGPIVFEGYPNEKVIIDGTVPLNSNWEKASLVWDNGTSISIYKTVVDFDKISKEVRTPIRRIYGLFVNDRYMIPAMPYNFKNPTDPTIGNPNNPEPNTVWSLSTRPELAEIPEIEDEDNETQVLAAEEPDDSSLHNIDNETLADSGFFKHPGGRPVKWGGKYAPGSMEFFDGVEEWAFDNNTRTIYLYASDNFTPNSTNVRIRVRDRIMHLRIADYITFKNIDFFAGSMRIGGAHRLTFENCRFSHSTDMKVLDNYLTYSPMTTVRNCIFEYNNDGYSWKQGRSGHPVLENVLFRYNDWFGGTNWSPATSRNYMSDTMSKAEAQGDQAWYGTHWRYITIENSWTAGISGGPRSLVEYARIENLYEGGDASGIQRNASGARYSTTRFTWILNAPGLNGMRFDSSCGARFGDIHNVVSAGNQRGFRLKGDFHDVYHVNAYHNTRQDISLSVDSYCGPNIAGGRDIKEPGNWNSNAHNLLVASSFQCSSEDCWAEGTDPLTNKTGVYNPTFDVPHLQSVGIWFGRSLASQGKSKNEVEGAGKNILKGGYAFPGAELANPWSRNLSKTESKIIKQYGSNPFKERGVYSDGKFYGVQSYDFRPKKGSPLIDSGVIIPGINDGNDKGVPHPEDGIDFNHKPLYPGQKRKFVGEAPDIGAYEYGDSVYWIPGFRYPHPSVPIPNDGEVKVPIDHSLVWNYPYKKDYSNTKASVKVSGPGVNLTKEFKYPHNVFFQTFEPGGTYNWSVTVDGVSGGNWSFKTDDRIYPLNDRSVDTTEKKILKPQQPKFLEVSENHIAFFLFDIPSSINANHKIKLHLVPELVPKLNGEIEIYKYDYKGWGEKRDKNNIGIINHSLGTKLAALTSLANGTPVSVDLTDKITSYGEEFSIALKVSDPSDEVYFYSKESGGGGKDKAKIRPHISFE